MKRLVSLLLLAAWCTVGVHAQRLSVEQFAVKANDLGARTQPRQDNNGTDCALLKVQLAVPGAVFEGNVIGSVGYSTSEYRVYMSQGSKRLTVRLEGYLPLEVNFGDYGVTSLASKTVYVMTIAGTSNGQSLEAPRVQTGWVVINSEPANAAVYINDEFVGNTPLSNYKQAYGTYAYRIEHPNYHPATGTIELNAGRAERSVRLSPAFGAISVTSSKAGASVLLDGKPTGQTTPCTISEVPSGEHTVTLQMDKYSPRQQRVVVEDGQTAQLDIALDARFAMVTVNTLEGAQIYCNGQLLGSSSHAADMMEGYYDLEARRAHYKPDTKQIQVVAGQPQQVTLNPVPIYGSLDVTSTPHDADVSIDGKPYGKTPLTIERLLEGAHTVEISMQEYAPATETVSITENELTSVNVVLSNDKHSGLYLADIYAKGEDLYKSKDYAEALNWFRNAAEKGNMKAQARLGHMYYKGLGTSIDYIKAIEWYEKAAHNGNVDAQYALGNIYRSNKEFKNYPEALKWYKKAADNGYISALCYIGWIYERGQWAAKDYPEAFRWYMKAAEKGNADAQNHIGHMYYEGIGVNKDYAESLKWLRMAADNGNAAALYNIGWAYEHGHGVQKNTSEALKWYREAAANGFDKAKNRIKTIEEQ